MSSGDSIRVVLADDEQLLRYTLGALLTLDGSIAIVGQASDGAEAVTVAVRERPDVLVIDLEMPGTDGLHAVESIRRQVPEQKILMLTRHARPGVLRRALKAGVRGFMSKSADPELIGDVIHRLHEGGRWVDHDVLEASMIDDSPLSDRELDALRVTLEGYSVREIAARLHLAPGTVRNYLSSAMQKTHSATRQDAARHARSRGWL
ncbi:response regulator transcription factor [Microbacterium paludicola]|uniref:Response regulator transcription factor n=1 Tax=Microbacterium paludicola TaxID=300019 RepID=A0A4Y9FZ30_9MICO|nr:response regulator transcription factor [Microbacterium paludicola]MBF0815549.1 response regulator transcription factor [Microbacterium paludicola]TFU33812.1 response regulator transcription factor [Microbacterium paludicola]